MRKSNLALGLLLSATLGCVSQNVCAANAVNQSVKESARPESRLKSVMNDIKASVPATAVSNYSSEEVFNLWRQLQPELTDKLIGKYGASKVMGFVDMAMDYINDSAVSCELPDFSDIINDENFQQYVEELETFLSQVVPLYTYQFGNTKTPCSADPGLYTIKDVYDTPKDACFYGVGDERNTYDPNGIDCEECKSNGGKLKANGSYVWGMATDGKKLYWGTNNNYLCQSGMSSIVGAGATGAIENSCYVCEFEKGQRAKELAAEDPRLAKFGDIMPSRLFSYDTETGIVTDISPDDKTLDHNQGIRSAIYFHGIVFFGGPDFTVDSDAGQTTNSTFVAYSTEQNKIIGTSNSWNVSGYAITDVRRWLVVDDVLYCGVGTLKDGEYAGAVLRWTGSADDPFKFEIVGFTSNEAAELEYHKGHIYVAVWTATGTKRETSTLYKSPAVPAGGLTAADAKEWDKVWQYSDYDENSPIPTDILSLKSFNGKLYWGTYSSSYVIPLVALSRFKTLTSAKAIAYVLGALRRTVLFCSDEPDGNPNSVELLYGEKKLPIYDNETGTWSLKDNVSHYTPKWGRSGYGNPYTSYTWAMDEYNDKLYIGTMDVSTMVAPFFETISKGDDSKRISLEKTLKRIMQIDDKETGYECLVLSDSDTEPKYVTVNGFGNHAAYGIRNMQALDGKLFIGTANPQNLNANGGWQVLSLEENGGPTSVASAQVKPAGIMFKQNEYYLEFSSMKGEKIGKVTLTDMSGKTVYDNNYGRTLATVVTEDMPKGVYIVNINTESDRYSMKVTLK